MTTAEIEKAAITYDRELKTHPVSSEALREDLVKFGQIVNKHWQEKTRWIPVEERLPEYHGLDSKEYLVKLSVGSISRKISYTTSRLINEHRWSCEADWRYVTHWKEIE